MIAAMKRREFITLLGGAAATWPLAARAQQADRVRRIGMLIGSAATDPESPPSIRAFQQTLQALGWTEGRNIQIDYRWSAGDVNVMRAHAKELLASRPDVVVTESTPATATVKEESAITPIIFVQAGNPIGSGFVKSFAHPGGNLTGFTNYEPTMAGKWLELLKEIAPRVRRAAALFNPKTHTGQYWRELEAAAKAIAVEFVKAPVRDIDEIGDTIRNLAAEFNVGVLVMPDSFIRTNREHVVTLTVRHRIPAIYPFRFFAANGGLASYGMDVVEDYRSAASYVDRVLRGEKPADLPVQAPTKFQLVINVKTAKALGLEISPGLLLRADEVIE
jgi:putative tryptophan/tyrosine transport system substrate-binding protein